MKLKTVTFWTAIAQLVSLLCSIAQYIQFLSRGGSWDSERIVAIGNWSVHLVAAGMVIVFLFTLVSRQKSQ